MLPFRETTKCAKDLPILYLTIAHQSTIISITSSIHKKRKTFLRNQYYKNNDYGVQDVQTLREIFNRGKGVMD